MKRYLYITLAAISAVMSLCLTSCGDSDEPSGDFVDDFTGTWYGTRSYYNPASGTKFQYLSVTFNDDKTGEITYESDVIYSIGYFIYSLSGNKIICNGAWASTDGDVDEDFSITFERQGDRLIPIDKYNQFILTKDGSVETNGDGIEVVDNSEYLQQVWVEDDGRRVIEFYVNGKYDQYILASPFSDRSISFNSGSYQYDARKNKLYIDGTYYDILVLTESVLSFQGESDVYTFNAGTRDDIPKSVDLKSFLTHQVFWHTSDLVSTFIFRENGVVVYMETSSKSIGSYGHTALSANGTFSVSGDKIKCNFTDVTWEYGSNYPNLFPGWTYNQPSTKVYTAEVMRSGDLRIVTPEGETLYFEPA